MKTKFDLQEERPTLVGIQVIDFTKKESVMGTYKDGPFIQITAESSDIGLSPFLGSFVAKFSKGYIYFLEEGRDMDGSGEDCYGVNYTSPKGEYKFLIIND